MLFFRGIEHAEKKQQHLGAVKTEPQQRGARRQFIKNKRSQHHVQEIDHDQKGDTVSESPLLNMLPEGEKQAQKHDRHDDITDDNKGVCGRPRIGKIIEPPDERDKRQDNKHAVYADQGKPENRIKHDQTENNDKLELVRQMDYSEGDIIAYDNNADKKQNGKYVFFVHGIDGNGKNAFFLLQITLYTISS